MTPFQLVVFDWDGTLMDSLARIVGSMQAAALDLGIEPRSRDAVHDIVGLALDDAIARLHPELNADGIRHMHERYAHHYVEGDKSPSPFFEGARELYDHQTDPAENQSLAGRPEHKELIEQLAAQLKAGWQAAKPK